MAHTTPFAWKPKTNPDAPTTTPNFPQRLLLPGIPYVRETVYSFTR